MKLQKSNHTILLVLEKGEDIVECITNFADDQDLTFTSVSGIGACDDVVLKFFNLTTKQYEEKHITEPLELTRNEPNKKVTQAATIPRFAAPLP
ncbi:PPC domain-containing DNA-binding protein, partial [Staphylococcus aureus]|uniref:PPC domain-containing DNA-binding protein n=1 Tax=Staphylococcus aureus TaxID=1280 RepID=UPI001CDC2235